MKRISYYIFALLSFVGAALQSCTDEIQYPNGGDVEKIPEGITLRIPDPAGLKVTNTRAAKDGHLDLAEKEGLLNDVYLVAFKGSETEPDDVVVEKLTATADYTDSYGHNAEGQKQFDLTGYFQNKDAGTWYMYVLANVDAYLPEGKAIDKTNIKKKADLDAIKLNFFSGSGESTTYLLEPSLTQDNGLPMVCKASEMMVMKDKDTSPQPAAGGIALSSSTNALIHADVSFLCAKVRYTILFDNKAFSEKMFADKSWELISAYASNVYNLPYSLLGTKNESAVKTVLPTNLFDGERKYPAEPESYPTSEQAFVDNLGNPEDGAYGKRCFQGTFYLPGNGDTDALTTLAFTAKEQHENESNEVENGATLNYKMTLLPNGEEGIVNAHAYDIVAKVTGLDEMETEVKVEKNWTTKILVYSLMPATYLHIDKTVVDMTAGSNTEIEYTTNAASIEIEGPKVDVNGELVQLYKLIKTENGKMYVSVNSQVPVSRFATINSEIAAEGYKKKYHEFYIIAGNIRKKIDIENLTLQRFMTVDPITITIDAKEKIASGEYWGDIYVTIRTNLDKIYLNTGEKDDDNNDIRQWYTITKDKSNCLSIVNETNNNAAYWQSSNNQITLEGSAIPSDGVIKLKIHFDRVNTQGETFWNTSKVLTFVVSCDNDGIQPGPGYIFPEKVNVNLLPNNDNYIIYFKDNDGWINPHMYIYQCLELPMATGKKTIANGTYDLSSYPVGYTTEKKDNVTTKGNAALEYLFSGGIAFKGWDHPDNKSVYNSIGTASWIAVGFFMFSDADDEDCSWNPGSKTASKSDVRYYKDLDFNSEHRKTGICSDCSGIRNTWPGIGMHKVTASEDPDNAGWWKYELSGLATPGKCLLMFTDGHSSDGDPKRYPKGGENGIPLFNHPNRVGYIELSGSKGSYTSKTSQTAGGTTDEEAKITKIYFTNPDNWPNVYAYMYGSSGANSSWPGVKMTKVSNNLYSYEIPTDKEFTTVVFNDGGNQDNNGKQTGNIPLSNQYDTYDKTHAYTNTSYNGNSGNGGGQGNGGNHEETHSTFQKGERYAIVFSGTHYIWMELKEGSTWKENITTNYKDWPQVTDSFEFTPSVDGANTMRLLWGSENDERSISASNFKWNSSTSRHEYTVN